MTRLLSILLLIFTCVGISSLHAQPDTPPPYLYYYSQLLGGLIIERADGTDSRQIAADVIPPNMTGLSGPGWSPSGKYFAAYGVITSGWNNYRKSPFLIDLKGHPIVDWLNTVVSASEMNWSPTGENILLVIGSFDADSQVDRGSFVWLIDAQHNKVLAEFGFNVDMLAYTMSEITWDTAHQQIVFYLTPDNYNLGIYYRITMRFDGTTLRELVSKDQFIPRVFDLESDPNILEGRTVSPHGTYETKAYYPLQLINTHTGETVDLPRHTQAISCRDFLWRDDEIYMMTFDGTGTNDGCGQPTMGVTNSKGTLWRELGGCSWSHPPCAGWLPETVNLQALPFGAPKPVQLDPIKTESIDQNQIFGIDPTVAHVLTLRCNQQFSMADIQDNQTQEVLYQLTGTTCPYNLSQHIMPEEGIQLVMAEDPVHGLLATFADEQGFGVSIWKLKDGLYEPLLKLNTWGLSLEFTDNNQYLRARNYNGWKIYSVADILASAAKPQE